MSLRIPERLAANCRVAPQGPSWLEQLPATVRRLAVAWNLEIGPPFESEVSCSWVAPALQRGGARAVLKVPLPHMEAAHELDGLRFWDGDGTVRVLAADDRSGAMLLERCEPGTPLRALAEPDQDAVLAAMLRRLWKAPPAPHPFLTLAAMTADWARETEAASATWLDAGLVKEGLRLYAELSVPAPDDVLLATDLHAGNVLRAQREPWLAIDPKPFVGERAYDATQHLMNCDARLLAAPAATIARFAALLEVDAERVRLWTFARCAARARGEGGALWGQVARAIGRLAPLA